MGEIDLFTKKESNLSQIFNDCENFTAKLHERPDPTFIDKTADGKSETLVISYIENKLDEMYSGLWSATNFRTETVLNEIIGIITLKVFHPKSLQWIERDGTAAIFIMMNKDTDFTDLRNKKQNALYLGIPKLKAECLKNAAKSLGVIFGRELNRKKSDTEYNSLSDEDENVSIYCEIDKLILTTSLQETEIDIIKKVVNNPKTAFTRLLNIKNRLTQNQK